MQALRRTVKTVLQTDSLVWLESTGNRSDGQTYRGMSPVVDDVMDAGRRMQQQELPPLIPRYCQRVSLINPTSASHVQIKFNVYLLKECNKHIWTDYTYTLLHTHFINIWIRNTDAKFRFNYCYNSVTYNMLWCPTNSVNALEEIHPFLFKKEGYAYVTVTLIGPPNTRLLQVSKVN